MAALELVALRRYGVSPLAVLQVNGNRVLYDLAGIRALMARFRDTHLYPVLADIERQMLIPGDYTDLQDGDFSGQRDLF